MSIQFKTFGNYQCLAWVDHPTVILKYDGRWEGMPGDNRQWTLLSHFLDEKGHDRYHGSFNLPTLMQLGIVKSVFLIALSFNLLLQLSCLKVVLL